MRKRDVLQATAHCPNPIGGVAPAAGHRRPPPICGDSPGRKAPPAASLRDWAPAPPAMPAARGAPQRIGAPEEAGPRRRAQGGPPQPRGPRTPAARFRGSAKLRHSLLLCFCKSPPAATHRKCGRLAHVALRVYTCTTSMLGPSTTRVPPWPAPCWLPVARACSVLGAGPYAHRASCCSRNGSWRFSVWKACVRGVKGDS